MVLSNQNFQLVTNSVANSLNHSPNRSEAENKSPRLNPIAQSVSHPLEVIREQARNRASSGLQRLPQERTGTYTNPSPDRGLSATKIR